MWGSRKKKNKQVKYTPKLFCTKMREKSKALKCEGSTNLVSLNKRKADILATLPTLKGFENLRKFRVLRRELQHIEIKIKYYESNAHISNIAEQAKFVMPQETEKGERIQQARKAILLNILDPENCPAFYINPEKCVECGSKIKVQAQEAVNSCMNPQCGVSPHFIYCKTDFIEKTDSKNNTYEREKLYVKFLLQHWEHAEKFPQTVIETLYKDLSFVHIISPASVKSTPIANILRRKGLQKYANKSSCLAREFCGEQKVKFSLELITKLVVRLKEMTPIFIKQNRKSRKIINFEFLTKKFLEQEGLFELAELFSNHRTRTVLVRAEERVRKCSQELQTMSNKNWSVVRSC